jgi:cytochrome c553
MKGSAQAALAALGVLCLSASGAADSPPIPGAMAWAYQVPPEKMPFLQLPAAKRYHVEGSALSYTGEQLNQMDDPVDWRPTDHPPPPEIVTHGSPDRKIEACGGCHGMDGQGFLAVPNLSGLSAPYIAEQLREFATGRRHSASPGRPGEAYMAQIAGKLTPAEIKAAAGYFSQIVRPSLPIKVTEVEMAPRTVTHHDGWQELAPEGGSEPIGQRVVLVAEDFPQMWLGDPLAGAIAYVPPGALKRGKQLERHGSQPCTSCHGAKLKGIGNVPPLAGRNPTYLARQLWDIKSGARSGAAVALMQKPAGALSAEQIVDVAAYLASLTP